MTRFDVLVEEVVTGEPVGRIATVHIRGGLQLGSNVGRVDSVLDGGRGVWFCTLAAKIPIAVEGGLLYERGPGEFGNDGRYVDAGVSLDDIRTMVNWQTCGTRAYP